MPKPWSTADIPSQHGLIALVTGGNSGIGWHTVLELARAGAQVVLTARSAADGEGAVARVLAQLPAARVRYVLLDLAQLASVRQLAEQVAQWPRLDLLVNNAGVMRIPTQRLSADGFERQWATNVVGPFALTLGVLPALCRAPRPRVTTVSSILAAHGTRRVDVAGVRGASHYSPHAAYCQSKLANLLFMTELARRSQAEGLALVSNASHPGWAMTRLHTAGPERAMGLGQRLAARVLAQSAAQGALPSLRALTEAGSQGGDYFGPAGPWQLKGAPVKLALPAPARNPAAAEQLWALAEQWVGIRFSEQLAATRQN
ncbi:oxidoreductase [Pseudomonas sp. NPDC007930]|uniref:oxidoreductase n=1 Tax=Pseudomonas sp. NPDC007930 TaxID=3364417 RepID=UPI0036EB6566